MIFNVDKMKFYSILCLELLLWIFLTTIEIFKKKYSLYVTRRNHNSTIKWRDKIQSKIIYVGIHEWAGYDLKRKKKLKNGTNFDCGLQFQLERFQKYKGGLVVDVTVTLSDDYKYKHYDLVLPFCNRILPVSNAGYDFSGYAAFFNTIRNKTNSYVILSNSSVNALQDDFLDFYVEYMNANPDVGGLGVSLAMQYNQTLIKNNFTPHIQSFFLMSSIDVLREIVARNRGKFPGDGIKYKLLLIRKGEVQLSQLILDLGYKLAVVQSDGSVFKFGRQTSRDNCYASLYKRSVEQRLFVKNPNKINPIKKYC